MDSERACVQIGKLTILHDCTGLSASKDPYPDVWHRFKVTFANRGFQANLDIDCLATEFASFRNELSSLYETLQGSAKLETLELDLELTATADKFGHVFWDGWIGGDHGTPDEARLKFCFKDDQTSLPLIIRQIDALMARADREARKQ